MDLLKKLEGKKYGICIRDTEGIIKYINSIYLKNINCEAESFIKGDKKESILNERDCYLKQKTIKENNVCEKDPFIKFIGKSDSISEALNIATKASKGNSNVVIFGESGTGKELIAEGIHKGSYRANGPFIRVNCAAIPSNLLESELFGHERGAFTGAIRKKLGKFELAENGSIFLDEIGDLEKSLQVKILRVIQEKEFQRVGGEETLKTNARIIAATNRNLKKMVEQGDFREDLYYRLNVIPIQLPPLRNRKDDIELLIDYFLEKMNLQLNKNVKFITGRAMKVFMNYNWPGNIRELENIIERIMTLIDEDYIDIHHIPKGILEQDKTFINENDKSKGGINNILSISAKDEILPLKVYEKKIIETALKKYGSFNAAGKALGISHKTVAAKSRQYGVEKQVIWDKRNKVK